MFFIYRGAGLHMIYFNAPYTQIHSNKLKKYMSPSRVNTGSENISEAGHVEVHWQRDKRHNGDRRESSVKPLLDLRTTSDRRNDAYFSSIDVKV
jgi:hypothetical protein